jgi:peptide/nickel transport system permease protein
MMRLLARRVALYIVTAIVAITVNFFIPRLMPGNPVEAAIGHMQARVTPATIKALDIQYGLNTKLSLLGQYVHYVSQLLHGNLGISFSSYPSSVTTVIRSALPWTIGLVGMATIISFVLGTLLGIAAAWRRGSWLDNLLPAMTFFQAAPYFFVAILMVALFATKLGWFPQNSGYDTTLLNPGLNWAYITNMADHAVLPALTIVVGSIAGWIIGMRNMMLTTMDEDYVLIAQAKGLSKRRVITYAARNAILPSVSGFSLAIGFVVSGSLLTEIVFSYPGIGFILLQAIGSEDYPLLQGIFLIVTFAVLAANLIADLTYSFLDPRTRQEA